MSFKISFIYKSVIRHLMDAVDDMRANGVSVDLTYFAFDTRGEKAEMEDTDLLGLAGWSFDENRGLWLIRCGINISTINDENLFREMEIIDALHDYFGETNTIPMRDGDTGEEFTQLVVSHFEMMPPLQSEKRNYRPIGLELLRTSNDG